MDPVELEKAQTSRDLFYLDTEIQSLARGLSLMVYKRDDKNELKPINVSNRCNDEVSEYNVKSVSSLPNEASFGVIEKKQDHSVGKENSDKVEYSWNSIPDNDNKNYDHDNNDDRIFVADRPLLANPPIVSTYVTTADDDDIDLT